MVVIKYQIEERSSQLVHKLIFHQWFKIYVSYIYIQQVNFSHLFILSWEILYNATKVLKYSFSLRLL